MMITRTILPLFIIVSLSAWGQDVTIIPKNELVIMGGPLYKGAIADTYRAKWSNVVVAAKIFNFKPLADYKKKFEYISKAIHPSFLVPIYGIYEEPQKFGIVYQLMDYNLQQVIANPSYRRNDQFTAKTIYRVASAIAYLHSKDIAHGGLKSSNVLLNKEGLAFVTDFELLQFKSSQQAIGRYSAPETLKSSFSELNGQERLKALFKADFYAIGLLAWELNEGQEVYAGKSDTDLTSILTQGVEKPQISTDWHNAFQNIISDCLKEEPNERPDAKQIMATLKSNFPEACNLLSTDSVPMDNKLQTPYVSVGLLSRRYFNIPPSKSVLDYQFFSNNPGELKSYELQDKKDSFGVTLR